MKLKLLACEVFTREFCRALSNSEHIVDCTFLPFGLHGTPDLLRERLQREINATSHDDYDFILLGYGLCSRGTAGLEVSTVPVVIPRAHDCITLFLGSKERYSSEFIANPGTYYFTPGWIERSEGDVEQGGISDRKERQDREKYLQYVDKYGEDNAKYLMEQESNWLSHYDRAALIDTKVGPIDTYRQFVQGISMSHGWKYMEIDGEQTLIDRMLYGKWDNEDFLIIRPGETIAESFDEQILTAKPL